MSRKKPRSVPPDNSDAHRKSNWMPVYLSIAGLIVLTLVFINFARPGRSVATRDKSTSGGSQPESRSSRRTSGETAEEKQPQRRPAEYKTLVGRWLRGDGDYVIQVRRVDRDGTADVSYFNPQPINVSEARASKEGDRVEMFVELRDVGYPGSYYRLNYNPESDLLEGIYFQAAMQEEIPVGFVRLED